MDGSRFDTWTRRRFGLAAGGLTATLLGLASQEEVEGKHHHHHHHHHHNHEKKCTKAGDSCTKGGKHDCCHDLHCREFNLDSVGLHLCCHTDEGKACSHGEECCPPLVCSDGSCQAIASDRALKTNFGSVDAADMLTRVRELPISTWNYTSDDASIRHIGPMAQDFAALFGVGADERHLHPLDGQGVALAAIQALAAELERLREENARLAERIHDLEQP